jgi:hypothetical protein
MAPTGPAPAPIVLHVDIDVLGKAEMPAAYFPHADGLTLEEAGALLRPVLADPRGSGSSSWPSTPPSRTRIGARSPGWWICWPEPCPDLGSAGAQRAERNG